MRATERSEALSEAHKEAIHMYDYMKALHLRFYREPEVHDVEGIGIGLYLTRRIAELQGGYVKVKSEPGNGSTFSLYLPR